MSSDPEMILKSFIDLEKIPHALIFIGDDISEMMESARSFAKEVFMRFDPKESHISKMDHEAHLDFHVFLPASKTGQFSIEQIKQICNQSNLYPGDAPKQFFVLKHAHRMQDAAGNALLKTLEEPSKDSIFILMVESIDAMLPTIISRAHKIYFQDSLSSYDEKSYCKSLDELLVKWPKFTYNDVYVACEDIQKKLDVELALQKKENPSQSAFMDKEAFALLIRVQKWYQEKILQTDSKIMSIKELSKIMDRTQTALERSTKLSTCLEYLLLSFAS